MRNIALSTTVRLLVPVERHANDNGLVGTAQGLASMVTSVFSGLSIGLPCGSGRGFFALLIFSKFNNLIGGVYMALMDPGRPRHGVGLHALCAS